MASNYNIMANYIVSKYIERVSGKDLGETFVDDDPSKRVMVGMLSEDRVEAKFEGGYVENTNTRFDSIPSISISFIVKKNESGILHVIPAGLLFYMVQPSYEKTVQYMLERYSEKDSEHYTDILQLCECYPEIKFNLPLTYKKIDIASVMADGIEIKLSDITPGQTFHLKQKIAEKLSVLADQIANEICIVSQSRISFFDLTEPDRFRVVTGIKDERVQPRWDIDIVCNVKEEGNTLRFLLQMVILGYAPYGRSITDGMWESVYFMRRVVYHMMDHLEKSYETLKQQGFTASIEEYQNMLFDYWIELVYNNRKQDAIELENAFQNQANNRLAAKNIPLYVIKQMTSDVDFQTVRKTLFDIQTNKKNTDSTNLILATSTISHGVDEDSFNIMYFFGMPNNNAEYIQAYSRTGRKYTGIVIDIIRLMRVRDRSYLKNFVTFHQNKDDLVESVPINRWAKNAIYSTLPGILSGVIMQYYTILTDTDHLYHAVKVKKMLIDGIIRPHDVINMMIAIYDCRDNEKMSLVYKEIISEEVTKILNGIQNGNFTKEEFLSTAIGRYSHGKLMPMRSLRDTEEQIEIKLR